MYVPLVRKDRTVQFHARISQRKGTSKVHTRLQRGFPFEGKDGELEASNICAFRLIRAFNVS